MTKACGDEERAFEIDVEDEIVVGFGDVPEIGAAFEAGVVDEDVDAAESGDRVGDEFLALVDFADVGLEGGGFAAELLNHGDDFVGACFVGAIAERDVGAFASETLDDGAADALVAAGDCHHFSFEPIGHVGLPSDHLVQKFRCAVGEIVSVNLRARG